VQGEVADRVDPKVAGEHLVPGRWLGGGSWAGHVSVVPPSQVLLRQAALL
jgi:hypothetical protein